jgi:hypothetical protein
MILAMCREFLPGTTTGAGSTPATDGLASGREPDAGDLIDHRYCWTTAPLTGL